MSYVSKELEPEYSMVYILTEMFSRMNALTSGQLNDLSLEEYIADLTLLNRDAEVYASKFSQVYKDDLEDWGLEFKLVDTEDFGVGVDHPRDSVRMLVMVSLINANKLYNANVVSEGYMLPLSILNDTLDRIINGGMEAFLEDIESYYKEHLVVPVTLSVYSGTYTVNQDEVLPLNTLIESATDRFGNPVAKNAVLPDSVLMDTSTVGVFDKQISWTDGWIDGQANTTSEIVKWEVVAVPEETPDES